MKDGQDSKLSAVPDEKIARFQFDKKVSVVFDDMISRSVPAYRLIANMQADLCVKKIIEQSADKPSVYIDLGCSTGNTLLLLKQKVFDARQVLASNESEQKSKEKSQRHFLHDTLKNTPKKGEINQKDPIANGVELFYGVDNSAFMLMKAKHKESEQIKSNTKQANFPNPSSYWLDRRVDWVESDIDAFLNKLPLFLRGLRQKFAANPIPDDAGLLSNEACSLADDRGLVADNYSFYDLCGVEEVSLSDGAKKGLFQSEWKVNTFFLNYTLQFVKIPLRIKILQAIFSNLENGGWLFLSEKTVEKEKDVNAMFEEQHHLFKLENNYNELEISRKRKSIEGFLVPETLDDHIKRLKKVGFRSVSILYRWYNFVTFIATK